MICLLLLVLLCADAQESFTWIDPPQQPPSDSYVAGTTHSIHWHSTGIPNTAAVSIALYVGGQQESVVTASTSNTGSYNWPIPAYSQGRSTYSLVISLNSNTSIEQQSAQFTINVPAIFIQQPLSGTAVTIGFPFSIVIAWSYMTSPSFKVEWRSSDGSVRPLTNSLVTTQLTVTLPWNTTQNAQFENVLAVIWNSNSGVTGLANLASLLPTITVSPISSTCIGYAAQFLWTPADIIRAGPFRITLEIGGVAKRTIASYVPTSPSGAVTTQFDIGFDMPTGTYAFKVVYIPSTNVFATMTFEISNPTFQAVTVSGTLVRGMSAALFARLQNSGIVTSGISVTFDLYIGTTKQFSIGSLPLAGNPPQATLQWNIPSTLINGTFTIRALYPSPPTALVASMYSSSFSISTPSITIGWPVSNTYPIYTNANYPIRWSSANIGSTQTVLIYVGTELVGSTINTGVFLYKCTQSGTGKVITVSVPFWDSWKNSSSPPMVIQNRGIPLTYDEACVGAQPGCMPGAGSIGRGVVGSSGQVVGKPIREQDFYSSTDTLYPLIWETDNQAIVPPPTTSYKVPENIQFMLRGIVENDYTQINTVTTKAQFHNVVANALKLPYNNVSSYPTLSYTDSYFQTKKVSVAYTSRRIENHYLTFSNANERISGDFISAVMALTRTNGVVAYSDWLTFFNTWGSGNYTISVTIGGLAFAHVIAEFCDISSTETLNAATRVISQSFGVNVGFTASNSYYQSQEYLNIAQVVAGGNGQLFNPSSCVPIPSNQSGELQYSYDDACTKSYANWVASLPYYAPGVISPVLASYGLYILAIDHTIYQSYLDAIQIYIATQMNITSYPPATCSGAQITRAALCAFFLPILVLLRNVM